VIKEHQIPETGQLVYLIYDNGEQTLLYTVKVASRMRSLHSYARFGVAVEAEYMYESLPDLVQDSFWFWGGKEDAYELVLLLDKVAEMGELDFETIKGYYQL
jgi:hypothetical protein